MRPAPLVLPVVLPEAAALDEVPEAEPELLAAELPPEVVVLSKSISLESRNRCRVSNSRSGGRGTRRSRTAGGGSLRCGTNRAAALRHGGVDAASAGAGRYGLNIGECRGASAVLEDGRAKMMF